MGLGPAPLRAADPAVDFFEQKIRPLLVERCQGCHSSVTGKTSGGLALDTRQGWATGGDGGPAIVPGKPDESLLIQAVRHTDLRMPPTGRLPSEKTEILVNWVVWGAFDSRTSLPVVAEGEISSGSRHWAFQPPVPPVVPQVGN
ncbi:MAG: c-type cytochrome domain-containing protein, partial [Planctomycetaceae bacterium]